MNVCCILPAHDAAPYIAVAIESILVQTKRPSRIIVVDDGSTDETREIVQAYSSVDYIYQTRRGPSVARNRGIRESKEDFIAFLDADDLWTEDRLSSALAEFARNLALDVSVCHAQNFTADRVPSGSPVPAYVAGGMLARRTAFDRVGLFAEHLPHALMLDWFVRAREIQLRIELLPSVLLWRRLHVLGMSVQHAATSHSEHLRVLRDTIRRHKIQGGRSSRE